jgi:hypothetical protein
LATKYAELRDAMANYNQLVRQFNQNIAMAQAIYEVLNDAELGGYIPESDWATARESPPPVRIPEIGEQLI